MTLPSDIQAQLEEALRLRGWLVNSFAQVEYLLGDLILQCQKFPCYDEHTKTLPHGANTRIERVRAILKISGPLDSDADDLAAILDHLGRQQDTRNLLVHGFTTALYTATGAVGLHFQKFHRQPDRQDARLVKTFTLSNLLKERDEQGKFAKAAVDRFQAVYDRLGWHGPMSDKFRGDQAFGQE
ncbi:MAG: hypothetical protein EOO77_23105 [Oxalobacteraceae bacterium]|nr:MAG: hypothetical protein EOO77_23105 [Oxalobacteraceae bacterium]